MAGDLPGRAFRGLGGDVCTITMRLHETILTGALARETLRDADVAYTPPRVWTDEGRVASIDIHLCSAAWFAARGLNFKGPSPTVGILRTPRLWKRRRKIRSPRMRSSSSSGDGRWIDQDKALIRRSEGREGSTKTKLK